MSRWLRTAWDHPSAVLLFVQLLGVLLYPFMAESATGRGLLSLFAFVVLVLAVRAVRATPAGTWVAYLLAVPVVAFTVLEAVQPESRTILLW